MDRYFSPVPVTDLPSRLCTVFQWIFFLRPEKVFLLRFYPDRPFSLSLFFYSPGRVSFPFLLCAPANVPLSVAIPCRDLSSLCSAHVDLLDLRRLVLLITRRFCIAVFSYYSGFLRQFLLYVYTFSKRIRLLEVCVYGWRFFSGLGE